MNNREKGTRYEDAAFAYLTRQGVRIIERNLHSSQGEIDLIGYHQDCLVFFEVKYRRTTDKGRPEEAVNLRKIKRISRTAAFYLHKKGLEGKVQVRFDVVTVCGGNLQWYQNAFDYMP